MKICVVGLGIIGGSLCLALKRAKYTVYGWNRNPLPLEYALTNGVIDGVATHFKNYDVVLFGWVRVRGRRNSDRRLRRKKKCRGHCFKA